MKNHLTFTGTEVVSMTSELLRSFSLITPIIPVRITTAINPIRITFDFP